MRVFGLILVFAFAFTGSAEEIAGVKITGSLDGDYIWNFNEPAQVTAPSPGNLTQPAGNNRYRAFDLYHDQFGLALAELVFQKSKGDVSAFISLDFGHIAEVVSPNDEVTKNVGQAYLTYTPKQLPELSIKMGKMNTHMGYELIKTSENWNYSRSLLFAYALPYWHTGASAQYSFFGGTLVPSLYIYNSTSGVYQQTRSKSFGAQLKATPAKDLALFYNYLSGPEISSDGVTHVRTLHEAIATYQFFPKLAAATDFVYGQLTRAKADESNGEWAAWTIGLKWSEGWFYLSPRFEIYWDRSGASVQTATATQAAIPQRLQSETLTAGFDLGDGLNVRLEYRHDHSTEQTFAKRDGSATASQTTLGAGILYDF